MLRRDNEAAARRLLAPLVTLLLMQLQGVPSGLAHTPPVAEKIVLAVGSAEKDNSIDRKTLLRVLSGDLTRWPDGHAIVLVFPPRDSPEMAWLCRTIIGVPEQVYRRFVFEKVFAGSLRPPLEATDSQEAAELIGKNHGAIGPLPTSLLGVNHTALHYNPDQQGWHEANDER